MNQVQHCKISDYIGGLINAASSELTNTFSKMKDQKNSEERANTLEIYTEKYRLLMLKTFVLMNWCKEGETACIAETLFNHVNSEQFSFARCSEALMNLKNNLILSQTNVFAVHLAYDILCSSIITILYCLLENGFKFTDEIKKEMGLELPSESDLSIEDKNRLLKIKLMKYEINPNYASPKIENGKLTLKVNGYFEVILTIDTYDSSAVPTILNLSLLFSQSTYLSSLIPQCNGYITKNNEKAIINQLQMLINNYNNNGEKDHFKIMYIITYLFYNNSYDKIMTFCNNLIILILLSQLQYYGYHPDINNDYTVITINIYEKNIEKRGNKRNYNGEIKNDKLQISILNKNHIIECKLLSINNNEYDLEPLDTNSISIENVIDNV